ncbi:demethylmenaquinone methyltransferase/2-methoxy-6-polyprenyl-1,4-benzoquinol methylase [Alkalihalobacillus xiaoxiensis]|uniref:Demethylmenaquinone methyltransferase n=1 Tax=Shouchella xiaoxiensis TaxID=766895 RepID=A0ABS2SXA7_9BACI|nr:demethylmenaquinone methyltransferase [Shouchella xiaoxiensis]MBM7840152.1 demethylmenaquinone methyltransferase/2-methoxy-6-polyprenyl-1,4-benzoquinol methylase [Shouchella xiaoxiensis]
MSQSKEERVHDVFQSIHKRYDMMNSVISLQRHKSWRKDTMKRMQVEEGNSALDVCCGTADWTLSLSEAVGENGRVKGLDFSKNMLEVGQLKVDKSTLNNIELIHGNAMELPYEDNTFDYVTIGFGLRNVPDYLTVLKEMCRVAKPGGKIVCLETSQPTIPVFKQMYFFYFKHVMPLAGKLFVKKYDEYSWLQESTMSFPGREKLAELFKEAGMTNVVVKSYTGGVASMHLGEKPIKE